MASTMAGPARGADRHGMPVGPRANGSAGSMNLLVLFVGLFLVVDVGPRAEDRLDQVDAQRGAGSGAREGLASGLFPGQTPEVAEDDHQWGSILPPPQEPGQGPA